MKFWQLSHPIRQAVVFGLGYRNRWLRYGREFRATLAFIRTSRGWTEDRQVRWQAQQLRNLVDTAKRGSRFYSDLPVLPRERDTETPSLRALLDSLPLLGKRDLKHYGARIANKNVRPASRTATSGSTGSPTIVEHDRNSLQRRFAFLADHLDMCDSKFSDPSIRLSGRILCDTGKSTTRPWLYNAAERQLFLSTYHLDETHASVIVKRAKKLQPRFIDGYPSAILQCLRILNEDRASLGALGAIITTAETLTDDQRDEIRRLAKVPVLDYYAASEGVPLIQQCPFGTYHVRWQSGVFEVMTEEGCQSEGDGELVATSFAQERMPLIRYRTGDLVTGLLRTGEVSCKCGLVTPTVERVDGRAEDMVYTRDGRALGMFTFRTLKWVDGLEESQVIQEDYDRFRLRAVLSEGYLAEEVATAVEATFENALGYPISLEMEVVDEVPKGPNGKVRLVISELVKRQREAGSL